MTEKVNNVSHNIFSLHIPFLNMMIEAFKQTYLPLLLQFISKLWPSDFLFDHENHKTFSFLSNYLMSFQVIVQSFEQIVSRNSSFLSVVVGHVSCLVWTLKNTEVL